MALFIEREDKSLQAFYLGSDNYEKITFQDKESLFVKIVRAYKARRIVVAFPMEEEPVDEKLKAVFVNLDGTGASYTDFYRCNASATEGITLGEYIGAIDDPQYSADLFSELYDAIHRPTEPSEQVRLQQELIAAWGHPEAWRF
jgi:hypothetical protein